MEQFILLSFGHFASGQGGERVNWTLFCLEIKNSVLLPFSFFWVRVEIKTAEYDKVTI